MSRIRQLIAREVLDSRGKPTLEVEVHCTSGHWGRAIVPSGASTGGGEARELRDQNPQWYEGQGVQRARELLHREIAPAVKNMEVTDQFAIDKLLVELDGTPEKGRLGANTVLGVSLAVAHAAAQVQGCPLFVHLHRLWLSVPEAPELSDPWPPKIPLPQTNMISGGLHAPGRMAVQDVLAVPQAAPDYPTALEWLVRIHRQLGRLLVQRGLEGHLVADEGGYGPQLKDHRQAIELLYQAIHQSGLRPGEDVLVAVDVASSHFWNGTHYRLGPQWLLTPEEMIQHAVELAQLYPISSLEDPLHEEAWSDWARLRRQLPPQVDLIGDDLLCTQAPRVQKGVELQAANAVLVKMNQVGTLSETLRTMRIARAAGWKCIVSARSGETEDTTMADLAVATAAEGIKIGSVTRSERLAKYNQLLRLWEQVQRHWNP